MSKCFLAASRELQCWKLQCCPGLLQGREKEEMGRDRRHLDTFYPYFLKSVDGVKVGVSGGLRRC